MEYKTHTYINNGHMLTYDQRIQPVGYVTSLISDEISDVDGDVGVM